MSKQQTYQESMSSLKSTVSTACKRQPAAIASSGMEPSGKSRKDLALISSRIIATIHNADDIREVLPTPVVTVFLLASRILALKENIKRLQAHNKNVFIHLDLMEGLGKDEAAVEFVAKELHVTGIISTRSNLISAAQKYNILAIQRIFIIDSQSLATSLNQLKNHKPDYVELLPAPIPSRIIASIKQKAPCPLIAGGLIQTEDDVFEVLNAGALAVSTNAWPLWNIKNFGAADTSVPCPDASFSEVRTLQ